MTRGGKAKFYKHKEKWRVQFPGEIGKDITSDVLEGWLGVTCGPKLFVIRQLGESTLRVEVTNGFITRASICPGNVETLMSGGTEVETFTLDYVNY